jgi:hypothetical protein
MLSREEKNDAMPFESTYDAIQRIRLEALTIVDSLKRPGALGVVSRADHNSQLQLTRLRNIR